MAPPATVQGLDDSRGTLNLKQVHLFGKKGACLTLKRDSPSTANDKQKKKKECEDHLHKLNILQPSWNYSWSLIRCEHQPPNIDFLPMSWGGRSSNAEFKQKLQEHVMPQIQAGQVKLFLAFNEPDRQDQSNMSCATALERWPLLEALGVPLCSPSCARVIDRADSSHHDHCWMHKFMDHVKRRNLRVDVIGVHWYGPPHVQTFQNFLLRVYQTYGRRPLLLTEFAVADWKAQTTAENRFTPEKVLEFMTQVLPWMEEQDWILGYAWFCFPVTSCPGTCSALFDGEGCLTACGRFYRQFGRSKQECR